MILPAALLALAAAAAGTLESAEVDELSGLATSRADPTVLWGHNDTGGAPVLYRIGPQGEDLGSERVHGAVAGDWEDVAAFRDAGGPALLIADTGDNFLMRSYATLYAVRDPGRSGALELLWKLDFRFADGGHDCEAVAVDEQRGEILLLTKRDRPPRLYRLPLPLLPPSGPQVAELVGEIAPLPRPSRKSERFAHAPTALDISADGLAAAIVTPRNAYLFRRRAGQPWIERFREPVAPRPLPYQEMDQIEAGALSADGRWLTVGSEGLPAPWVRLPLGHPGPVHPD